MSNSSATVATVGITVSTNHLHNPEIHGITLSSKPMHKYNKNFDLRVWLPKR